MKSVFRRSLEAGGVALAALGALVATGRAFDAIEWKNRQPLVVERAGMLKLALPPETLGLARPGLEDLRLIDPAGREVPFVFTRPAAAVATTIRAPQGFQASLTDDATQLLITTGTTTPIEAVTLTTPAPGFLKAAQLEISADGARWETLAANAALFRQFGTEQLRFEVPRRPASLLRITIDDTRSRPVPFTGATLQLAGSAAPVVTGPVAVRLVRREEYTGETVLTLDLGGANVPLAEITFDTAEPLFARPLEFGVRELRDEQAVERTLGSGVIWRVAADGRLPMARLNAAVRFTVPARELLVHVRNGDSPPLAITGVAAQQRPIWLVFQAPAPGAYALLTGHPQVPAPRYDLATLAAELGDTPPSGLVPGPAVPNPGYRASDPLLDTPLRGAAIDPSPWSLRKAVQVTARGVQQLELDLEVLARAQAGLADLRLVSAGAQVPYLLERPPQTRSIALTVTPADDPKRPRLSRWQVKLPRAGVPLLRLTLFSPTPLFQRQLRLFERVADAQRGEAIERTLASAEWSHRPGELRPLTLGLTAPPAGDTLFFETDNGDNPPIERVTVQAAYPVARLLFKAEAGPAVESLAGSVILYYGQRAATAPRYDLALVAGQLLAAEKLVATLGPEEEVNRGGWGGAAGEGSHAGWIFWSVLALVVVGLLVVVAKLLPKPPTPPAG